VCGVLLDAKTGSLGRLLSVTDRKLIAGVRTFRVGSRFVLIADRASPDTKPQIFSTDFSISGTNDVRGRIKVVRAALGRTRVVESFGPNPPAFKGSSSNS
jgi:hypothetical protein